MKTLKCRGRLCLLVCGWLWISGLLLMGKVLGSLSRLAPGSTAGSNMDAVGTLQIFFLLFTATCAGLYFTWNRQMTAGSKL
jgi:hypothetical protein